MIPCVVVRRAVCRKRRRRRTQTYKGISSFVGKPFRTSLRVGFLEVRFGDGDQRARARCCKTASRQLHQRSIPSNPTNKLQTVTSKG